VFGDIGFSKRTETSAHGTNVVVSSWLCSMISGVSKSWIGWSGVYSDMLDNDAPDLRLRLIEAVTVVAVAVVAVVWAEIHPICT